MLFDRWELVPDGTYGPFGFAVNAGTEGLLFCAGSDQPLRIAWQKDIEVRIDGAGCDLARAPSRTGGSRWWNPLSRRPTR